MRFTVALASLAFFMGVNAQTTQCTPGSCWSGGPSNATNHGCAVWDGGVNANEKCGFEGAITCTTCLPCSTDPANGGCYTSPTQAEGTGCTQWGGGVGPWETCGFTGAVLCLQCAA
ncbi:hypothetical protein R3P38DRAFT_2870656 [Favolaschia claudopus]|uniref:Uncharacterized protein n=1 Tax=Favolaschia claudopus TaxID=2862362 RepID=A0AAW0DAS5_9AGAR